MQKNIPFFRIADRFIAGTIARASGIFIKRRSSIPKTPQGILCVSIGGIGTSILVLPSIKAISKIYPKAELTVLCNKRSRDVFINQPFIKSVKILDISFSGVIDIILKNIKIK